MIIEGIILVILGIIALFILVPSIKLIRDDEVGIVTKKMFGKELPQGQIIATEGEVGVQAEILMPGLYFRLYPLWVIERRPVVNIKPGEVGIVESIEGQPLQKDRLLGDEVECNSYQDARMFLKNGGRKGAQVATLRPGTYRINTKVFKVYVGKAITIPAEKVGIVTAQDGTPLGSDYIIAPEPTGDHKHFQDGQTFINREGHRGVQLETLQPGEYYINYAMFKVDVVDVATIQPGYVAVIISSVGKELETPKVAPDKISTDPNLDQPIHEDTESVLITTKTQRGILRESVAPGKYNLNTVGYKAEKVPVSAITIDWGSREAQKETRYLDKPNQEEAYDNVAEFYKFSQLRVTSKDGFQLEVDVRLIIRIPPANAPFVIARFGTVANLIEQVAHPLIDSSFRNEAGNKPAMEFVLGRTALQTQALDKAKKEFEKYHVEVQGLLIAYIKIDEKLLETQTRKEIALQQQNQYKEEAKAQEERIAVSEKTARADKQKDVIDAKLSVEIAKDKAEAMRRDAEGTRDATMTKADGDAYQQQHVGEAVAKAYEAQANVLEKDKIAAIKMMQEIAAGKVVITPNVLVEGGSGDGTGGNLLTALIAKWLAESDKKVATQPKQ